MVSKINLNISCHLTQIVYRYFLPFTLIPISPCLSHTIILTFVEISYRTIDSPFVS